MKKCPLFFFLTFVCLFAVPFQSSADDYYKRGDTNGDSIVSITDVTTLIDYLLNGRWPDGQGVNPPAEIMPFVVNSIPFKMILVEGGTFTMGLEGDFSQMYGGTYIQAYEQPAHQVQLSSYYIGETEVTQELWLTVMGTNPSNFTAANGNYDNLTRPVESVSWDDCQEFIAKLNEMTGLNFRLPTDAEWEFAAKGGTKSLGYKYSGSNTLDDVAWCGSNNGSGGSFDFGPKAVATKAPNELGIYDMSGNVNEWCQDWFAKYGYYAQVDPTGPESGTKKVWRGGAWKNSGEVNDYRVTFRRAYSPSTKTNCTGLRLALSVE